MGVPQPTLCGPFNVIHLFHPTVNNNSRIYEQNHYRKWVLNLFVQLWSADFEGCGAWEEKGNGSFPSQVLVWKRGREKKEGTEERTHGTHRTKKAKGRKRREKKKPCDSSLLQFCHKTLHEGKHPQKKNPERGGRPVADLWYLGFLQISLVISSSFSFSFRFVWFQS